MIENYAEKIKHESNGFIRHNGIRIVSVDEERSVLEAEITDNSRNVWGSVHGGFLYTMADTAAGAFARIKYGRRNVTLNGSMNYLRPTTHSRTLTAVGREIKVGGHVGFFEVDITDDTGVLVACARAVCRAAARGEVGCRTLFDIPPADLFPDPVRARETLL